jgi:hypothetical protein
MGLPFEAPSGGEDDSSSPAADRFTDDLAASGYDGYSHDVAPADEYQDAIDEDGYEDDLGPDDLDEGGFGGQLGWDPGADGPSRM